MDTPLLYYTPGTCALSELICLEWIGKPYHLTRVERDERTSPAFLAVNPHGSVPAMKFGDRILVENNALLTRLADQAPEAELIPAVGTDERDDVGFWLSYIASRYHAAHFPIFKTARYSDREELHDHLREVAIGQVKKELEYLNGRFEGKRFAVGGKRGIIDAYFVATGRWARKFHDYAEVCPNFDAYLTGLDEDPGVKRAKEIELGKIKGPDGALQGHVPLS